jgi:hypothetical protein
LPINSNVAISTRGLNIDGVVNNAQMGAVYRVLKNIPAVLRSSLGGTGPEFFVEEEYRQYLQILEESISSLPTGR